MQPNSKYKAFQKMCAIVGRNETYISSKIREKTKKGVEITISITNPTTGLEFIMMVSMSAIINDEYLVHLYENHRYGMVELMARKMIIAKPVRASPRREPGLSEVFGTIAVISIAVGAGLAFYHSTLDVVDIAVSENMADIHGLTLIAFIPDDGNAETRTVYADMTVSLLFVEDVKLGGEVRHVHGMGNVLFNGTFTDRPVQSEDGNTIYFSCYEPPRNDVNCRAVQSMDGITIHYSDILELESKKKIGDSVNIIVEYGDQSRTVSAVVDEN